MFTQPFEHLFTPDALGIALHSIRSRAAGIDKQSLAAIKSDPDEIARLHEELMQGIYAPQPIEKIEIEKNETEKRPIALSSVRDKVVQKCLAHALGDYFERLFSDKSYGYRPSKGTLRAINRTTDFIRKGAAWAYKSDIDNFFETIDHERLLALLEGHIRDKRILAIIALLLKNGGFARFEYAEHDTGVHQGDALSPLLSNIYLHQMDAHLEAKGVDFVRYADDFVLLGKTEQALDAAQAELRLFLESIGLKLGEEKSYMASIAKGGFEFLGCRFIGHNVSIDNEKLQKKISKFYQLAKKQLPFKAYVDHTNTFVEALSRYYLKLITQGSEQFGRLEEALLDATANRVFYALEAGEFTTKKAFKELLEPLMLLSPASGTRHEDFIERIINRAFERHLAAKDYTKPKAAIEAKKRDYAKKFALQSVLHVSEFGASLGIAKNKITLKIKGKVRAALPKAHVERIIINAKGISISSNLVYFCATHDIAIDFLDHDHNPYAALYTHRQAYAKMALLQLEAHQSPKRLELSMQFVRGKAKNQINYLKYLDRYHRDVENQIAQMELLLKTRLPHATDVAQLMGYEGQISALYWEAIAVIVKEKIAYPGRITQGATDPINAALNYGYAILYGKVQFHAAKAGLALHVSFLHALDEGKPTLVFDMIEEFRAFVVDRVIISMVNQQEPLELDSESRLTKSSRQLIAKKVTAQLGNYTRYKKESRQVETLIADQAYLLSRAIKGEDEYHPFVGKY
ncbi:MAG: CRISPR-associated endonuclease Cas1 [Campylobacterales bacterium]|nr:CRISPR-associated endonuclease Cas1 [Campylobacterales bacterium]